MKFIIMTLVGMGLSISKANGWFVVPDFCFWICYGSAASLALVSIINYVIAKNRFDKINKRT